MRTSERLCACGCGEFTAIAKLTNRRNGHIKGQPVKFRVGHYQRTLPPKGYRGGSMSLDGRITNTHIAIAARALGRPLPRGAEVHHVNGKKSDNRPANLVICQDHAYHALLHQRGAVVAVGGDPNTQRFCRSCRRAKDFTQFHRSKSHRAHGLANECKPCRKAYSAERYQARKEQVQGAH